MPIAGNNMHGSVQPRSTLLSEFKYDALETALDQLRDELSRAMAKHAPMHSPHEGHSVIREELHELWEHVMADTGQGPRARKEALQVAAMGLRYALDLCTPEPEVSGEAKYNV